MEYTLIVHIAKSLWTYNNKVNRVNLISCWLWRRNQRLCQWHLIMWSYLRSNSFFTGTIFLYFHFYLNFLKPGPTNRQCTMLWPFASVVVWMLPSRVVSAVHPWTDYWRSTSSDKSIKYIPFDVVIIFAWMSTYCVFTNRHCIYPECFGKEKDLILPGEWLTVTLQMKGKCSLRGKRKLNKQLKTHV